MFQKKNREKKKTHVRAGACSHDQTLPEVCFSSRNNSLPKCTSAAPPILSEKEMLARVSPHSCGILWCQHFLPSPFWYSLYFVYSSRLANAASALLTKVYRLSGPSSGQRRNTGVAGHHWGSGATPALRANTGVAGQHRLSEAEVKSRFPWPGRKPMLLGFDHRCFSGKTWDPA